MLTGLECFSNSFALSHTLWCSKYRSHLKYSTETHKQMCSDTLWLTVCTTSVQYLQNSDIHKHVNNLTGMRNSCERYFSTAASWPSKLLLCVRLPGSDVSNSFLTTEATESKIRSPTRQAIMSSSRRSSLCNIRAAIKRPTNVCSQD